MPGMQKKKKKKKKKKKNKKKNKKEHQNKILKLIMAKNLPKLIKYRKPHQGSLKKHQAGEIKIYTHI